MARIFIGPQGGRKGRGLGAKWDEKRQPPPIRYQRGVNMKGAILYEDCPSRKGLAGITGGTCQCKPVCKICGYGPHWAIHGPTIEDPRAGAAIWRGGHQFEPDNECR